MEQFERLIARHPRTTFIGAHVGCYPENLGWVSRMMETYPNFNVDIAARLAELGRQPYSARRLFERHADRIVFGLDSFPPTAAAYAPYFRFLETADEYFPYTRRRRRRPGPLEHLWDRPARRHPAPGLPRHGGAPAARLVALHAATIDCES